MLMHWLQNLFYQTANKAISDKSKSANNKIGTLCKCQNRGKQSTTVFFLVSFLLRPKMNVRICDFPLKTCRLRSYWCCSWFLFRYWNVRARIIYNWNLQKKNPALNRHNLNWIIRRPLAMFRSGSPLLWGPACRLPNNRHTLQFKLIGGNIHIINATQLTATIPVRNKCWIDCRLLTFRSLATFLSIRPVLRFCIRWEKGTLSRTQKKNRRSLSWRECGVK